MRPTLSRLENAPSLNDAIRLTWVLVDQWMASYEREPASVILDIDDTCDVVHGHQQLSLFNAHYDGRCFLPIHVYDTERSRSVAAVLRPGKTPSGVEVRAHLWATRMGCPSCPRPGAGDRLAPDRHRRAVRQRLMRTPFVIEGEPFSNAARSLPAVGVALEIDVFVFRRAQQPLDEHVVHPAAAAVHRDRDAG
jgi:Transposase DDE domain group 1